MQSLPTATICTLFAGIIHLVFVLFHNLVRTTVHSCPRNLSRAAEFAIFRGISMFCGLLQNLVLDGDKGRAQKRHILVSFRWP